MQNSTGYKQREKLFNILAKNVTAVKQHPKITIDPDLTDAIVCPICMKLFPREALATDEGYIDYLTLEDVPPKSLGGKAITLTCKICNNTAGSQLESHLKKRLDFEGALEGKDNSLVEGKIKTNDNISVNASINIKADNKIAIYLDQNRSNPHDLQKFTTKLNSGNNIDFSIDFFGKYKLHRPEVALLRIAYLIAYSTFGLGFIINPDLQIIRDQIKNPTEKMLNTWGIIRHNFPDSTLGINIIREPKELRAFFVVFDLLSSSNKSRIGVFLPGPGKPGLEIYNYLSGNTKTLKSDIKINAVHIFDDDYLWKLEFPLASNDLWFDILNKK